MPIPPSHVDYADCAAHEASDEGNEQRMGKSVAVLAPSQKVGMIGKIDVGVKESLVARALLSLCISCDELFEAVGINYSAKQGTSVIIYDTGQLKEFGLGTFLAPMLLKFAEQLNTELVFELGIGSPAVLVCIDVKGCDGNGTSSSLMQDSSVLLGGQCLGRRY